MKSLASARLSAFRGAGLRTRQARSWIRFASSSTESEPEKRPQDTETAKKKENMEKLKKTHKSMADLDEEMKQAMENLSGDGGEYGLELEGGKPVAMKRSVKDNMFRYI